MIIWSLQSDHNSCHVCVSSIFLLPLTPSTIASYSAANLFLDDCQSPNSQLIQDWILTHWTHKNNLTRYTTPHSTPPTLLATFASSLTNILPFRNKFQPSPNGPKPAITILDSFVVSALTSIPPQFPPLIPSSFTPNLITVILSTTTYLSLKLLASKRLRTLFARAVVKAPKSCHHAYHTLSSLAQSNRTHRIQTPLTHAHLQVLTTTHPSYLHNLISVQPPRSTTNIILVTYNWSFLSVCLTLSLESTSYSFLRQPHSSSSVTDLPVLAQFPVNHHSHHP